VAKAKGSSFVVSFVGLFGSFVCLGCFVGVGFFLVLVSLFFFFSLVWCPVVYF
jgi:hypothetical protein